MPVLCIALLLLCVGFILRLALLLVTQMAEGVLNFVFSNIPSRRRGIVPSGKHTEGWGNLFPEALGNVSSNSTGLNQAVCPPLSQSPWPGDGYSGCPWALDQSSCESRRDSEESGSLEAKCECCGRKRVEGHWGGSLYMITTSASLLW